MHNIKKKLVHNYSIDLNYNNNSIHFDSSIRLMYDKIPLEYKTGRDVWMLTLPTSSEKAYNNYNIFTKLSF